MLIKVRYFLIGVGSILFVGGSVRFYRLIRMHEQDHFFAPHLLLVCLSLFISWRVLKLGWTTKAKSRRVAISLIRSGSVLAFIWAYRLYLLLSSGAAAETEKGSISYSLPVLYMTLGTSIMVAGLWMSRSLRQETMKVLENNMEKDV